MEQKIIQTSWLFDGAGSAAVPQQTIRLCTNIITALGLIDSNFGRFRVDAALHSPQ